MLKRALLLGAALAGAGFLIYCARGPLAVHARSTQLAPTVFSKAGLSMVLGDEWQGDANPAPGPRPPTMHSAAGTLRVVPLPSDVKTPEDAAGALSLTFARNPGTIRGSFERERFVSRSGLRGIHVSCRRQMPAGATSIEVSSHHFIVRNREGRCVAVSYDVLSPATEAELVQQIQQSLSLQ